MAIKTVYDLMCLLLNDEQLHNDFANLYVAKDTKSIEYPKNAKDQADFIRKSYAYVDYALEKIISLKDKIVFDDTVIVIVEKVFDPLGEDPFTPSEYYSSSCVYLKDMITKDVIDNNDFEGPNYVETYSYEFEDWEVILGWQLSNAAVEKYGILECALAIFEELIFHGVSDESRSERKADLDESIANYEEIKDLPEEERNKHFIPADEVFAELEQNFYDSISDEDEKSYYRLKSKYDDMLRNDSKELRERWIRKCVDLSQKEVNDVLNKELKNQKSN